MTDMTDIELTIKALEEGILPAFSGPEVEKLLDTCDPDQARKMKRKFRKLWRKEMKRLISDTDRPVDLESIAEQFSIPAVRRKYVRRKLMSDG
jgi:hypothetical protein